MYQRILIPVDSSGPSNLAIGLGIELARRFDACLVGSHVYAARLHDQRFSQMEGGLPPQYREGGELERQRKIHDSLITRGLEIISDSYLDVFEARCRAAGTRCERKKVEGKNWVELVKEVREGDYDLVIIGALGLGAVRSSLIGSVCERVVRRARTDVLVVRNEAPLGGKLLVAVDGSPECLAGLKAALGLAKAFGGEVEAVAAFDPYFHTVAFRHIAEVLSEGAGQVFRFKEQERLHDEIINRGLEKIYRGYLETASQMASAEGVKVATTLLAGKPFDQILRHVEQAKPALLVVGRFGIHRTDDSDIGSTAENLLRLAPCNLLIVSREFAPRAEGLPWTEEAQQRLAQVPDGFMREMTKARVEVHARKQGLTAITPEVMQDKYQRWAQGSAQAESELPWTEEAAQRIGRIPPFIRGMVIKAIERYVREKGCSQVTPELVDQAKRAWEEGRPFH